MPKPHPLRESWNGMKERPGMEAIRTVRPEGSLTITVPEFSLLTLAPSDCNTAPESVATLIFWLSNPVKLTWVAGRAMDVTVLAGTVAAGELVSPSNGSSSSTVASLASAA